MLSGRQAIALADVRLKLPFVNLSRQLADFEPLPIIPSSAAEWIPKEMSEKLSALVRRDRGGGQGFFNYLFFYGDAVAAAFMYRVAHDGLCVVSLDDTHSLG